jgi:hypothetical protein
MSSFMWLAAVPALFCGVIKAAFLYCQFEMAGERAWTVFMARENTG